MSITYRAETELDKHCIVQCGGLLTNMTAQKHSSPSFATIISVISIVLYCAGFLRIELQLKEQKKRINALEIVADPKASSTDPDVIKIIENTQGRLVVM